MRIPAGALLLLGGWLRLDVEIERIKPGHPQQNGRHERMHLIIRKNGGISVFRSMLDDAAGFHA